MFIVACHWILSWNSCIQFISPQPLCPISQSFHTCLGVWSSLFQPKFCTHFLLSFNPSHLFDWSPWQQMKNNTSINMLCFSGALFPMPQTHGCEVSEQSFYACNDRVTLFFTSRSSLLGRNILQSTWVSYTGLIIFAFLSKRETKFCSHTVISMPSSQIVGLMVYEKAWNWQPWFSINCYFWFTFFTIVPWCEKSVCFPSSFPLANSI
jgi:hypothetical protein